MTHHLIVRAFHFFGIIFWVGGVVSLAMATALATNGGRETAQAARQVVLRIATPAMILAWVGGLGMLIPVWSDHYARAGWMHGKLFLVFVISGLSGALSGTFRKAANGEGDLPAGKLRGLALGILALTLVVVGLAVLKPGA